MSKNQVLSLYGQPSKVETRHRFSTWKYNNDGFDVEFEYDIVNSITIYRNGNRRFDWSGLSCNSLLDDFKYKYEFKLKYGSSGRGFYNGGSNWQNGYEIITKYDEVINIIFDSPNRISNITLSFKNYGG